MGSRVHDPIRPTAPRLFESLVWGAWLGKQGYHKPTFKIMVLKSWPHWRLRALPRSLRLDGEKKPVYVVVHTYGMLHLTTTPGLATFGHF